MENGKKRSSDELSKVDVGTAVRQDLEAAIAMLLIVKHTPKLFALFVKEMEAIHAKEVKRLKEEESQLKLVE